MADLELMKEEVRKLMREKLISTVFIADGISLNPMDYNLYLSGTKIALTSVGLETEKKQYKLAVSVFPSEDGSSFSVRRVRGSSFNTLEIYPVELFADLRSNLHYSTDIKNFAIKFERNNIGLLNQGIPVLFKNNDLKIDIDIDLKEGVREKEDLKVYETPSIITTAIAKTIDDSVKYKLVKNVLKRYIPKGLLINEILESLEEGDFSINYFIDKYIENEKLLKPDLDEKDERFQKRVKAIENVLSIIENNYHHKNTNDLIKVLEENNIQIPATFNKGVRFAFADFQAGSGEGLLKAFDNVGWKDSYLTGTEIRDIKDIKDERNKVFYDTNFLLISNLIKKALNGRWKANSVIYYLNPPYHNEGVISYKSVDAIPEKAFLTGLFSIKDEKMIYKQLKNGVIAKIDHKLTGYSDENAPSKYLLVFGMKGSDENIREDLFYSYDKTTIDIKYEDYKEWLEENEIEDSEEAKIEFITEELKFGLKQTMGIDELSDELSSKVAKNKDDNAFNMPLENLQEAVKSGKEMIQNIGRLESWLEDEKVQKDIMSKLSFTELVKSGQHILPDFTAFSPDGKVPLRTYNEVKNDIVYLSAIKELHPKIYEVIEETAKELGDKLPMLEKEDNQIDYITTEHLGIMKFKYYPKKIELTDKVKEVISNLFIDKIRQLENEIEENPEKADFLNSKLEKLREEYDILQEELKDADYIMIKKMAKVETTVNASFGNTPVLVLNSKRYGDIASLSLPVATFFYELEKAGIINTKDRYKVAEPDEELKSRILINFINDINNFYNEIGITFDKIKEIVKEIVEISKKYQDPKERANQITQYYAKVSSELKIPAKLKEKVYKVNTPYEYIVKSIRDFVKANRDLVSLNNEQIVKLTKEIEDAYKKDIYNMGYNRNVAEEKLNKILNEFFKDDKESVILKNDIIKTDLINSIIEGLSSHFSYEDRLADSAINIVRSVIPFYSLTSNMDAFIKTQNPDYVDRAFEYFKKIFKDVMGLKEHQFNEAVRFIAKAEITGEKGHLLGWEMRSGKTLAMLMTSYLNTILRKDENTFLFPKTANMNDIIGQMVKHLPFLAIKTVAYQSGDSDPDIRQVANLLSDNAYPNLFRLGLTEFLNESSTNTKRLLETYAGDMEEIISIYKNMSEEERQQKLAEYLDKYGDKPYSKVLQLESLDTINKLASFTYILHLDEELPKEFIKKYGYSNDYKILNLSKTKQIENFIRRLNDFAIELEAGRKEIQKEKNFHIVPKYKLFNIGYKIPLDERLNEEYSMLVNKDIDFEKETDFIFPANALSDKQIEKYLKSNNINMKKEDFKEIQRQRLQGLIQQVADAIKVEDGVLRIPYESLTSNTSNARTFRSLLSHAVNTFLEERFTEEEARELIKDVNINYEPSDLSFVLKDKTYSYAKLDIDNLFTSLNLPEEKIKDLTEEFRKVIREKYTNDLKYQLAEFLVLSSISNVKRGYFINTLKVDGNEIPVAKGRVYDFKINIPFEKPVVPLTVKKSGLTFIGIGSPVYSQFDKENPFKIIKNKVNDFVLEYSYSIKSNSRDLTITLNNKKINVKDKNAKDLYLYNKSNNVSYFINSEFTIQDKSIILDEADEAVNPQSGSYKSFFALGKGASLKVAATGTPTSGYPETLVALQGLVADLDLKSVVKSQTIVRDNFSIYSASVDKANSVNEALLLLSTKIFGSQFLSDFKSIILNYLSSLKRNKDGNSLIYFNPKVEYEKFLNKIKEYNEVYDNPVITNLLFKIDKDISFDAATHKFKRLIDKIASIIRSEEIDLSLASPNQMESVILRALKESGSISREGGTYDPIGLVSMLKGASISFQTRENLKSQSAGKKIKEIVRFVDKDCAYKLEKKLKGENVLDPFDQMDKYIYDVDLRYKFDVEIPIYKTTVLFSNIYDLVFNNLSKYINKIKENPNPFIKHHNLDINSNELRTILDASKKTTNDSVYDILKEVITFRKPVEEVVKTGIDNYDMKVKVSKLILQDLRQALMKYPSFHTKINRAIDDKEIEKIKFEFGPYSMHPDVVSLESMNGKGVSIVDVDEFCNVEVVSEKDGGERRHLVEFSIPVRFYREEWKDILKENKPIYYNLKLSSDQEHEIIDAYTNVGYLKYIKDHINKDQNFLVAPYRQLAYVFSLYDTLSFALEKQKRLDPKERKEIHILTRLPSGDMSDYLSNIDKQVLLRHNIILKEFKNHAGLDAEAKKMKIKMEKEKAKGINKTELIIVATGTTVARGVDFSMLDSMIVIGSYPSGKDFSQLLARIFHVNKHEGNIYLFGEPVGFKYRPQKEGEIKVLNTVTPTFYKLDRLLKKESFIKGVMSGEIANVVEKESANVISKQYAEILKNRLGNININGNGNGSGRKKSEVEYANDLLQ